MNAAKAVVTLFIEVCAPTGLMRYAPNGQSRSSTIYRSWNSICLGWSNFAAFACTFLLKVRP
jgi:hypothetical protein